MAESMRAQATPPAGPTIPLLGLDTLVPWLLERQLVSTRDVVDGPFEVRDYSRRNKNFKVIAPKGESLLVKQAGNPLDPEFQVALGREAALLQAIAVDPALEKLRWFTPRAIHHDPHAHVLVTALVHPATSVTRYHLDQGRPRFPEEAAHSCANVLGAFHRVGSQAVRDGLLPDLRSRHPFIWDNFASIDSLSADRGPADKELWGLIQRRGAFWSRVPALKEAWAAHEGLVHLDVRLDNFLLTHGSGPRGDLNLRLIDWELTGRGDPAWDVACFLAEYLRLLVSLVPMRPTGDWTPQQAAESIVFAPCHPAAAAFWKAYARKAGLTKATRGPFADRVRAYLPFNLVLLSLEMVQQSDAMNGPSLVAFELATQVAEDPEAAARRWFGPEALA